MGRTVPCSSVDKPQLLTTRRAGVDLQTLSVLRGCSSPQGQRMAKGPNCSPDVAGGQQRVWAAGLSCVLLCRQVD